MTRRTAHRSHRADVAAAWAIVLAAACGGSSKSTLGGGGSAGVTGSGGATTATGGAPTGGTGVSTGGMNPGGAGGGGTTSDGGSGTSGTSNGGVSTGGTSTGGTSTGGTSTGGTSTGGTSTGGTSTGGTSTGGTSTGGTSTGGTSTGGTSTGGTSTGGTSTGGTSSGGAGGTSATGGTGGACAVACISGRTCCNGECVSTYNDPRHCGSCGNACGAGMYCSAGTCDAIPCSAKCGAGTTCCGGSCCATGQLCCDPARNISGPVQCEDPNAQGTCEPGCAPLCACASPDTPIATPTGERPIASLVVGDLVYTADANAFVAVPIVQVHRTPVTGHHVMRVVLASGRVLMISAAHPTADGRTFADLRPGSQLGAATVVSAEPVPYNHPYTVDILPASQSGTYVAAGALIGSTLAGPDGCR